MFEERRFNAIWTARAAVIISSFSLHEFTSSGFFFVSELELFSWTVDVLRNLRAYV